MKYLNHWLEFEISRYFVYCVFIIFVLYVIIWWFVPDIFYYMWYIFTYITLRANIFSNGWNTFSWNPRISKFGLFSVFLCICLCVWVHWIYYLFIDKIYFFVVVIIWILLFLGILSFRNVVLGSKKYDNYGNIQLSLREISSSDRWSRWSLLSLANN